MKYLKTILVSIVAFLLATAGFAATTSAQGPERYPHRYPQRGPSFFYRSHHPAPYFRRPPFRGHHYAYSPRYGSPGYGSPGYVVKRGDTLFRIARQFGVPVNALLAANPQIRNPNLIYRGQRLSIPGAPGAADQPGYGGANGADTDGTGTTYSDDDTAAAEETTGQPPQMDVAQQTEVAMQNTSFQPGEISVTVGTTVVWTNQDSFAHTVTAGTRSSPSGLFDSGNIGSGGTFSFTFEEPGTYDYFCSIHPGMAGVVIVADSSQQSQEAAPQPAPSSGDGSGGGGGSY